MRSPPLIKCQNWTIQRISTDTDTDTDTVYNGETQTLFIDTKDKAICSLRDSNKSNAI